MRDHRKVVKRGSVHRSSTVIPRSPVTTHAHGISSLGMTGSAGPWCANAENPWAVTIDNRAVGAKHPCAAMRTSSSKVVSALGVSRRPPAFE